MQSDSKRPIDKLLLFLDYKGIKPGTYEKTAPLSQAYFANTQKGKGNISQETLEKLRRDFKDLNFYWLLFDEGEMIVSDVHSPEDIIQVSKQMKPLNPSQKETQKSLQTTQNCQECVEKDASIKTLKQLVNVLENTIADKMQIIAAKEKSIQLLELILYPKNSH